MKRYISILLVLFSLSPFLVLAQNVHIPIFVWSRNLTGDFLATANETQLKSGVSINISVSEYAPISELGLYSNKLSKLKNSIFKALEEQKRKKDMAIKGVKGGEAMQGNPNIDGPLYLLQKMNKELQLDDNGSCKEPAGLNKFFVHLKALGVYNDISFAEVIQNARDFTGFSYLFPPSLEKPPLIFIPGASGEPATYCGIGLLKEEAKNFNIIGYTFDPTLPSSVMTEVLVNEFSAHKLYEKENVVLMMSLGNTLTHSAVLKSVSDPAFEGIFSNSHLVSAGFLPGGASTFLGKPSFIPTLAGVVFPPYAAIFDMMNPANVEQGNIARNIGSINKATKSISYFQGNDDHYVDLTNKNPIYATNRDLILESIAGNVKYVSPPEVFEKNNSHINLLQAPEIKKEIEGYLEILLPKKSGSSRDRLFTSRIIPRTLSAVTLFANTIQTSGALDIIYYMFGGTKLDECAVLVEELQDGLMINGTDYATTANNVKKYLEITKVGCLFENLEKEAKSGLQEMGFGVNNQAPNLNNLANESTACGDANGDGRGTTLDIALIRKHILGLRTLDTDSI